MGYNNGYDSGWSDCEAKLMPRIKELEAQHHARPQGGATPPTEWGGRFFTIDPSTRKTLEAPNETGDTLLVTGIDDVNGYDGIKFTSTESYSGISDEGSRWFPVSKTVSLDSVTLDGSSAALTVAPPSGTEFLTGDVLIVATGSTETNVTVTSLSINGTETLGQGQSTTFIQGDGSAFLWFDFYNGAFHHRTTAYYFG